MTEGLGVGPASAPMLGRLTRTTNSVARRGPADHDGPVTTNYFDRDVAERYDDLDDPMFSPAVLGPTVDLLADLADGRAALELAIGTGRVALPLSERGVRVHGIELSEAMVDQLRTKPGSERIEVAIGDMTETRVEGRFGLAYLVFNTIGNVTTQEGQVAVFETAAAHLEPGGLFLIETLVPGVRLAGRARPDGADRRHAPA